ncbi:TetR/AcrR family transcriptional regulator [Kordiimonas aestuarii]|uniref:TetR/AcrR family transcriptional regulator n=1 Tax=Kordiimonas aestuarii TaxID=1005925 RepID=UPI0021D092D0|nr:TetR/AcrR family transcriptional regulator [Kordiimonas aestuarii]
MTETATALPTSDQADENRPTRGRPRDSEKNSAIIDAASVLFLENGFDGTSMDEVAKRAGVSKQTVYSHFSSKEQLFSEAIHITIAKYFPDAALEMVEIHTLESDLVAVAETYARLLLSDQAIAMHRVLVAAAGKGPELAQIFWQAGPQEMNEKLEEFIGTWANKGELKIDNLEKASGQLITLLKGKLHFMREIGMADSVTEAEVKEQAADAVACFLKLYKA